MKAKHEKPGTKNIEQLITSLNLARQT